MYSTWVADYSEKNITAIHVSHWKSAAFNRPIHLLPLFFIFPVGISTDFEAVRVKSNPAWLVHRGHFHNTCCSSQISLLNWGAGGYQSCQLHAISSNLLLNCLQKLQYIHMWVSKQKQASAEAHSVRVFQHSNTVISIKRSSINFSFFSVFFVFNFLFICVIGVYKKPYKGSQFRRFILNLA